VPEGAPLIVRKPLSRATTIVATSKLLRLPFLARA
jgi:hypothetical protein